MEVYKMLAGPERAVVEQKMLTLRSMKVRHRDWDMSHPPQPNVNSGFTTSSESFNILEHPVNRRRGANLVDGDFYTLDRRPVFVKRRCLTASRHVDLLHFG